MGNKTVVKHKIVDGSYTTCGRRIGINSKIRGNKTWKGVTCQKCLKQKPVKKVKVAASVGGV